MRARGAGDRPRLGDPDDLRRAHALCAARPPLAERLEKFSDSVRVPRVLASAVTRDARGNFARAHRSPQLRPQRLDRSEDSHRTVLGSRDRVRGREQTAFVRLRCDDAASERRVLCST